MDAWEPILFYIALHPDCTKYDLSRKTGSRIPYSTVSDWIRDLVRQACLSETNLGRSRAGIEKKGYRITWKAMLWIHPEDDEFATILKTNAGLSPLPVELVEKTGKAIERPSYLLHGMLYIRPYQQIRDFREALNQLLLDLVYFTKWIDRDLGKTFMKAAIGRLIELNSSFPSIRKEVILNIHRRVEGIKKQMEMIESLADVVES